MPIYNLIEYSDIYSKTSRNLWQYYRDELVLNNNNAIIDFPLNKNHSILFKCKEKITGHAESNGTRDVGIMVPLKYVSNFWRRFEMQIINCEISLTLT